MVHSGVLFVPFYTVNWLDVEGLSTEVATAWDVNKSPLSPCHFNHRPHDLRNRLHRCDWMKCIYILSAGDQHLWLVIIVTQAGHSRYIHCHKKSSTICIIMCIHDIFFHHVTSSYAIQSNPTHIWPVDRPSFADVSATVIAILHNRSTRLSRTLS